MPAVTPSTKKTIKKSSKNILAIDIGGSHIKATVPDANGKIPEPYQKEITPVPATPAAITRCIKKLTPKFTAFNKISVGFPGYVKTGVVYTAPNLGRGWAKVDFAKQLSAIFKMPVRLANDADMQELGVAKGKGFEIAVTLGTGFGTAFLPDGKLLPHLELAHHPVSGKKDYDAYIGDAALKKIGKKKWNNRMKKVLQIVTVVFNYDHLYLGGGNTANLTIPLAKNISIVSNADGIHGGQGYGMIPNTFSK
jgi:polyphosphate glucokinase